MYRSNDHRDAPIVTGCTRTAGLERMRRTGCTLAGWVAALGWAASAQAAIFTVTATNDSGPGTLRSALEAANAAPGVPHGIGFAVPPDSVITLASSLQVGANVQVIVDGTDSPGLVVDGAGNVRLFDSGSASRLTVRDLTLRNGRATTEGGGCLRTSHNSSSLVIDRAHLHGCVATNLTESMQGGAVLARGSLFIYESRFTDNQAVSSSMSAVGGAVAGFDQMWIEASTFSGNHATSAVGEAVGGAVAALVRLTVVRSRFIGNRADHPQNLSFGGAIHARHDWTTTLRQSLLFDNHAFHGSALHASPSSSNATTTLVASNNTIAGNAGGPALYLSDVQLDMKNNSFWKNQGPAALGSHLLMRGAATGIPAASNNLFAATASGARSCFAENLPDGLFGSGANLFVDDSCDFIDDFSLITDADLRIRGLRHTGSTLHDIPVVDLFADSPAIDNGNPNDVGSGASYACTAGDARDEPRPVDGNADGDAICDIGALELQQEASLFADDFETMLLR